MAKLALFLEGACEQNAIRFYLQNYVPHILVTMDVLEFIESTTSIVLLYDCGGYQNVLPKAKEYESTLWNDSLVLVRDLETTPCFATLKDEVAHEIPRLRGQAIKYALFSKPYLESVYQCDLTLFHRVMTQLYKETHGAVSPTPVTFSPGLNNIDWNNPLPSLKGFCRVHNMGFQKVKVAQKFFSQLNYPSIQSHYLVRLRDLFSGL